MGGLAGTHSQDGGAGYRGGLSVPAVRGQAGSHSQDGGAGHRGGLSVPAVRDWLALTARMGELVTEEDYQYQL